jgi:hypothetical protein
MAIVFPRTTRALVVDRFRLSPPALLLGAIFLAAYLLWFFFADVSQYERSNMAHVMGLHSAAAHADMAGMMAGPEMDSMMEMRSMADTAWMEGMSGMETFSAPRPEKIVAYFPAAVALGQLQPGQRAKVAFDGFPPLLYGEVSTVVVRIAQEVVDDQVQVELALDPQARLAVPVRHGMTGTVQVEVRQTTPAVLALRVVSGVLAGPPAPPESGSGMTH